jgi:predicted Zn-dependent protease
MTTDRKIQAAEGYGELGMFDEALAELSSVPEQHRGELRVSQARMFLLLQFKQFRSALEVSQQICVAHPELPLGFIHAAFCLHELGQTSEAREILMAGPAALLEEATYYYNLACYNAVLGEMQQARAYLKTSFKMNKKFREIAEHDPDLSAIWQEV